MHVFPCMWLLAFEILIMSIAIQITTSEIRYCISKNGRRRGSPKEGEIKLWRDKLETKIGGFKVEEMGKGGKCVEE